MPFDINLLALILWAMCLYGVIEHWRAYVDACTDERAVIRLHRSTDANILRGIRGDQREELLRLIAKASWSVVFAITMTYPFSLLAQYGLRAILAFTLQFLALGILSVSTYYKRENRKRMLQDALLLEAAKDHIERKAHQEI